MTHPSRYVEHPNPAAASCWGKERFETWTMADRAITRKRTAQRARGDDMAALTAYRCERCRGWHIAGSG